jgi:hypothetical protein
VSGTLSDGWHVLHAKCGFPACHADAGLQKKVEDVLNSCVKEKPSDPLAFMVSRRSAQP